MESSKQQKQNEKAERLARRNERNNKIQGERIQTTSEATRWAQKKKPNCF